MSGALVVKLFGSHEGERELFAGRARRVRDIGITTAMYSRVLFVALGFVAAVGTAVVYYLGGRLAIDGAITTGTVAAFVLYVSQIYQPLTQLTNARVDVMTALVSFERVFEVLDFPALIQEADDAVDLVNPRARRVRSRVVPAPRACTGVARVPRRGHRGGRRRPERVDPARRQPDGGARRARGARRPFRRGQDNDGAPRAAHPRGERRQRLDRRSRRSVAHAAIAARHGRHGHAGPAPVPRLDRRELAVRQARRDRRRARRGVQGGAHPRAHRQPARGLRHRRRRARLPHVGWREAAPCHRACCSKTRRS